MFLRSPLTVLAVGILAAPLHAATIGIQGGGSATVTNWNHIVDVPTIDFPDLVDLDGNSTGISLTTDDANPFHSNYNGSGTSTLSGDAAAWFPTSVTAHSLFASTDEWVGEITPMVIWVFSGLDAGVAYDFRFFASRSNVTDIRDATYSLVGANSGSADLNSSNNTTDIAAVLGILPDTNGEITLTVTPGPNNDSDVEFYYLGAMRVDYVPEPASAALIGLGGLLGLSRRRRV